MTIVRVGTTKKYSEGWDTAFGKGRKKTEAAPPAKAAAKKATGKKAAPKKAAGASTKKKAPGKKAKAKK